ncbi:receptor-like protein 6 isoform X2 [Rosa chinensis]|uniref:receptor-like protein 6 isoform X2 n=1 Tax=Rosa chinensis TaxID=74649 RepID=UPI001AD91A79|nr:receptor-like protein 6 isoform X2 [Rosa chinensis]
MGLSSLCLITVSIYILSTIVLFHLVVASSLQSYNTPTCHDDEISALLQFKQSFVIRKFASVKGAYPKISSWKSNSSCCSWDGVVCDEKTGHVIGLDLGSSCLYGSFSSNNTLFSLVHLQRLNLADNDFNFSQIPTSIRNFPRLRYLNLSFSVFSGRVPSEVSQLSKLSSLDLSRNDGMFSNEELLRSLAQNLTGLQTLDLSSINISSTIPETLTNLSLLTSLTLDDCGLFGKLPGRIFKLQNLKVLSVRYNPALTGIFSNEELLRSPAQNLTSLETLDLSGINISSTVPDTLTYLSLLTSLILDNCGLSGKFPGRIFKLQNLKVLSVSNNPALTGYFPDNYSGSSPDLMSLKLSSTNFFINLPSLIERFPSLKELAVSSCNISEGPVPLSLGNLRDLIYLDLSYNKFNGQIPTATLGNLRDLIYLDLSDNKFNGQVPFSLGNLRNLIHLDLSDNKFNGRVPFSLGNLRDLTYLDLSYNKFNGQIPTTLGNLTQLTYLSLYNNHFHGSVPQSLFNLINLQTLYLDHNNLSGTVDFQKFLNLQKLTDLDLSNNNLELLSESRFLNNATTVLPKFVYLRLGGCNIREFPDFLRSQEALSYLDLSGNKLQGQVPKWMWNTSTQTLNDFNISHNLLSGFEKSPVVLPWLNLEYLDLSFNMFHDLLLLPSTSIIKYYNIANNKLTRRVSPMICNMTSLEYLDLSNNKLIGDLPHCGRNFSVNLEYLKLGNNSFQGNLPQSYFNGSNLRMMDISHNSFQGQLPRSLANCASLESLVLSHNNFGDTFPVWLGALPELKILKMDHNVFYGVILKHDKKNLQFPVLRILDLSYNDFSGVERYYPRIREDLILIDISSNNFEGKIPEYIGKLQGIWSVNLSNNILTGRIPSSLSNLSRLESLDLSHNKLSGEIPQQLAQLDSLSKFNVSHNNLTGPVPRGIHFTTFDSTSYLGNQGLCGDLLPKKCGNSVGTQLPPSTSEDNDSGSGIELDWKFVVAGSGSGLLVGVVLADFVITKWNVWFIEIVAVLIVFSKRIRKPRN